MYPYCRAFYGFATKLKPITTSSLVQVSSKQIHLACRTIEEEQSKDLKGYLATYPIIFEGLKTNPNEDVQYPEKRIAEFLDYALENSSASYMVAFMDLRRGFSAAPLSEEDTRLTYIITWCIEIVRTSLATIDDVLDHGTTRRTRPCWYRVDDNNGVLAYNDAAMTLLYVQKLLQAHFRDKSYYMELLDSFNYVTYTTLVGEYMDLHLSNSFKKTRNFDIFTWDVYDKLCRYKAGPSMWYVIIWNSLLVSGVKDPELRRQVEETINSMIIFAQNLDDYLDYCNKSKVKKLGEDIGNGSCTWLTCTALEVANPEQRSILKIALQMFSSYFIPHNHLSVQECYGSPEQDKIDAVMRVYNEIGMKSRFEQHYAEGIRDLRENVQQLHKDLPKDVFLKIFKIHFDSQLIR